MAQAPEPTPPTIEQLRSYAEHFNQSATLRNFGVTISFPSMERVRVTLDVASRGARDGSFRAGAYD
jgi:hypothetical protein